MIKRCPHFHVHHSVYTIANLWKQSMCLLTDEWIKRLHTHTHTHTGMHNGILLSHGTQKILTFATTWMDLKGIILGQMIQIKKNTV